jgi:hypothetical protein
MAVPEWATVESLEDLQAAVATVKDGRLPADADFHVRYTARTCFLDIEKYTQYGSGHSENVKIVELQTFLGPQTFLGVLLREKRFWQ